MNTIGNALRHRHPAALLFACVLLCSGCLEKRIVWSPDGNRAAVIGAQGLYLCDGDGRLSGLLLPGVKVVAWLADSQQLVVSREREVHDWATLAPLLGDGRAGVEERAAAMLAQLQHGATWSVVTMDLSGRHHAVKLCLRDVHGTELKTRLSDEEWRDLGAEEVPVTDLQLVRLEGEKLVADRVLHSSLGPVADIRLSPSSVSLVAWTQEMTENKGFHELRVASLEGGAPAQVVARHVAGFPDWTVDGRSLVYIEATQMGEGGDDDAAVLGVLCRRRVAADDGSLHGDEKPEYLGGLVFNTFTHLRCLRDGRILFNSAEMALPMAAADVGGDQREQLFALDSVRQPTLVRLVPRRSESDLPQSLSFFEVSPDERQILIAGMKNEIVLLTLGTGEVTRIQDGAKTTFQGAPVWRRASEFTYVKRMSGREGGRSDRPAEIVLRSGDKETTLSATWPTVVLASIASEDRR